MTAAPRRWAAELLHYWFHALTPAGWFRPNAAVDAELRRRFEPDLAMLWPRPAGEFLGDRLTAQAAVLLFDQMPRNIYRGSTQAFAYDPLARAIARSALLRGWDAPLAPQERQFLAMPLMHSEDITDQRLSVVYFSRLGPRYGLPFARSHHRMIARFGRFPHRNALLGRESSMAERHAIEAGFAW